MLQSAYLSLISHQAAEQRLVFSVAGSLENSLDKAALETRANSGYHWATTTNHCTHEQSTVLTDLRGQHSTEVAYAFLTSFPRSAGKKSNPINLLLRICHSKFVFVFQCTQEKLKKHFRLT